MFFLWLTRFLSETLKPIVKTEFQLLYVYNLVGPFLQRFQQERTRCMLEVKHIFFVLVIIKKGKFAC